MPSNRIQESTANCLKNCNRVVPVKVNATVSRIRPCTNEEKVDIIFNTFLLRIDSYLVDVREIESQRQIAPNRSIAAEIYFCSAPEIADCNYNAGSKAVGFKRAGDANAAG